MARTIIHRSLCLLLLCGCQAATPSREHFSRLQMSATPPDLVLRSAELTLEQQFQFQITEVDRQAGSVLAVAPTTTEAANPAEPAVLPSRQPLRRRADVRVIPVGEGSDLYCRIVVERRESTGMWRFTASQGLAEDPSQTPIDRGEALTEDQNTLWGFVRRDRALERTVLSAVEDSIAAKEP